ncbi:metal-dependent hydrolase [Pseudomonas sp. J452]|uniref:metal-dependent hydrolase n=1 Tax=Pseudomonas sp. J452 TaxID=2898441 RepID=UPI0021AE22ED|nr:metal-dependent hydrolase [Pseudomonas sp. J452]UUY09958.1 metal-dependent hydrolase [Pseudomonas sp. J452]
MTTLISHPLPLLAVGLALGPRIIPPRLLLVGLLFTLLPDADMLAFKLGIAYTDAFGHRGFSHSLLFAGLTGVFAALACRLLDCGPLKAFIWIALATASHSLLDAATDGGLGVAWLWPWSEQRFFLPWRPIEVSPFINGFFSQRGLAVLASEARWVWLPCLLVAVGGLLLRATLGLRARQQAR